MAFGISTQKLRVRSTVKEADKYQAGTSITFSMISQNTVSL